MVVEQGMSPVQTVTESRISDTFSAGRQSSGNGADAEPPWSIRILRISLVPRRYTLMDRIAEGAILPGKFFQPLHHGLLGRHLTYVSPG